MPLYEYQCQSCGNVTEVIQRLSEDPLSICDECGGELKKLISAPAFQFKGSGWYVTDYADKGGGNGKGDSGKSESKTESGTKSDGGEASKSETKSPPKPEAKTKAERVASG